MKGTLLLNPAIADSWGEGEAQSRTYYGLMLGVHQGLPQKHKLYPVFGLEVKVNDLTQFDMQQSVALLLTLALNINLSDEPIGLPYQITRKSVRRLRYNTFTRVHNK